MKTSIECPMSWTHCRETRAHGARTRTPEDKPISQGTPDEPSQEAVAEAFKHSLIEYRSWRPCEVARPAAPVGLYWLRQIPKGGKPVVGLGLDALSLSGSLRIDADFLLVGLGEDPLRLQLARRAVLLGDLGPLGPHAFEDMLPVQFRQVKAADVDADHIDTIGSSGQVCDAANDFRRHGLIVALCWVGGDETDAGYRPMTAPISARMMSERRCSPAAGVSTVIVAARSCGVAAHETDGTTTCIGIPDRSPNLRRLHRR